MTRYLNYDNNRLFIVDMGLHYIYCLEDRDGWGGTLLGGNGKGMGQLHKPAGLVFDAHGNAMVVDSGNNRLQVLDTNLNFCGVVKVSANISVFCTHLLMFLVIRSTGPS